MKFLLVVVFLLAIVLSQAQWQFKSLRYKVYVKDLETTKIFYNQTMGYEIIYDIDSLCILDPHVDDAVIQFVLSPEAVPVQGSSLLFHVKDVTKLWEKLRTRVNVTVPLRDSRIGKYFAFRDLNGLIVGHYTSPKPKGLEVQMQLHTKNFEPRFEFYQFTLGLRLMEHRTDPVKGAVFVFGNSTRIELNQVGAAPAKSVRASHKVVDVWKLWDKIKATNTRIMYELRENSWGDDSFGIYDTDGYELELWTRRTDKILTK